MYIMMHGLVFSLVHAVVFLAVSFFILLAARKSDSQNIKTFGYVVAVLLWVAAALVFGRGIYTCHPMMCHKMNMMGEKMGRPMKSAGTLQQTNQAAPVK